MSSISYNITISWIFLPNGFRIICCYVRIAWQFKLTTSTPPFTYSAVCFAAVWKLREKKNGQDFTRPVFSSRFSFASRTTDKEKEGLLVVYSSSQEPFCCGKHTLVAINLNVQYCARIIRFIIVKTHDSVAIKIKGSCGWMFPFASKTKAGRPLISRSGSVPPLLLNWIW